jgi:hypothetical protein
MEQAHDDEEDWDHDNDGEDWYGSDEEEED